MRAANDQEPGVLACRHRRPELAGELGDGDELTVLSPERPGQIGVLDRDGAGSRRLHLLDGASDVERVAIAVVRVDEDAERARAGDPAYLLSQLGERDQGDVRGPKDRIR